MKIAGMFTGVLLSVLAGDLLYLYYAGAWIEPIVLIEVTEIIVLYILFFWGLYYTIRSSISMFKEGGDAIRKNTIE